MDLVLYRYGQIYTKMPIYGYHVKDARWDIVVKLVRAFSPSEEEYMPLPKGKNFPQDGLFFDIV